MYIKYIFYIIALTACFMTYIQPLAELSDCVLINLMHSQLILILIWLTELPSTPDLRSVHHFS